MNDKITIITINYNNKAGLQKTINSVLNQTSKNFDFIIIDGNSTDGSKELLPELDQYKFIQWLSEADRGIYHAMNKGIRIATGDYLLFLNSGDCLADHNVIEKIDLQIDGSYGIYYGDIIFDELRKNKKIIFPDKLTFDFFFTENLSHQSSFIKKTLFDEIFYYNEDYTIVSDWEFFIYAICKQNVPYKHLDILTTIYDGTGLSSNPENYKAMYQERDTTLNKYFPTFIDNFAQISQFKQKRVRQFFFIKEHPFAWKAIKVAIKVIFFFLPKKDYYSKYN